MIPFHQRVELSKSEATMFMFMVILMCGLCFTTGIMLGLSLKGGQGSWIAKQKTADKVPTPQKSLKKSSAR